MANEQNLEPVRTEEEAREKGRNGGIKSGEARRRRKTIRECVEMIASLPPSEKDIAQLEKVGIQREDANFLMAMVVGLSSRAGKDHRAFKTIAEYLDEDAKIQMERQKMEQELELKRQELDLRRRELELREKELERRIAIENGEIKEEDKVIIVNDLDELINEEQDNS